MPAGKSYPTHPTRTVSPTLGKKPRLIQLIVSVSCGPILSGGLKLILVPSVRFTLPVVGWSVLSDELVKTSTRPLMNSPLVEMVNGGTDLRAIGPHPVCSKTEKLRKQTIIRAAWAFIDSLFLGASKRFIRFHSEQCNISPARVFSC
jgi:hypothetical protein